MVLKVKYNDDSSKMLKSMNAKVIETSNDSKKYNAVYNNQNIHVIETRNEIYIWASLNHQNIVKVLLQFNDNDLYYAVTHPYFNLPKIHSINEDFFTKNKIWNLIHSMDKSLEFLILNGICHGNICPEAVYYHFESNIFKLGNFQSSTFSNVVSDIKKDYKYTGLMISQFHKLSKLYKNDLRALKSIVCSKLLKSCILVNYNEFTIPIDCVYSRSSIPTKLRLEIEHLPKRLQLERLKGFYHSKFPNFLQEYRVAIDTIKYHKNKDTFMRLNELKFNHLKYKQLLLELCYNEGQLYNKLY